ncbi:macrophage mannose receptor 1-like protein [Leptotrombidium deliense]|uniref:Macrophage mannose receptor 1-like protein n=1 Tax=Leptotrombidium deliense TaxID=299467 RepID=A0A443S2J9_9ACAR|nr:macrophage mannose receptor 1-like protein [Leptotrombidium deliense]
MKLFLPFIVLLTSCVAVSICYESCPNGWIGYRHKCYLFDESKARIDQNIERCRSLGAIVTSIKSENENKFIQSQLNNSVYWIGSRRYIGFKHDYLWSDFTPIEYSNWDEYHHATNETKHKICATISPSNGKWFDVRCSEDASQTCEAYNMNKLVDSVEVIEERVGKLENYIEKDMKTKGDILIEKEGEKKKENDPIKQIQELKQFIMAIRTFDIKAELDKLTQQQNDMKTYFHEYIETIQQDNAQLLQKTLTLESEIQRIDKILAVNGITFTRKVINAVKSTTGKLLGGKK